MNWKECGRIGRSLTWGSARLPARMDHDKPVRIDDLVEVRSAGPPQYEAMVLPRDREVLFLDPALTVTLMCPESKGTF